MRRSSLLAISLILVSLLILSGGASAALVLLDFTPTAFLYMPLVARQPTATPTVTPTPTSTPTPTATTPPGGGSLTGQLTLKENKPSYATNIEYIWFYELIQNSTGSSVWFGILGVNVTGPENFFHTSWDGAGTGGQLELQAGCYGPSGIPCAPNADAGRHEDGVIVHVPGTYQLTLSICYSSFSTCQTPGGNWQSLSSVMITAIDWTPTPSSNPLPPVTPAPADRCKLVTDDPRGIYLSCP